MKEWTTIECMVQDIRRGTQDAGVLFLGKVIRRMRQERDAAVRRARGRGLGYVIMDGREIGVWDLFKTSAACREFTSGGRIARVVAEPRRRR